MSNFSFFLNNKNGGGFITFAYRHRKQIIIGVICFVVLIGVICLILFYCFKTGVFEKDKNDDLVLEDKIDKKDNNTDNKYYKVDIKGEIVNPGIYELKIDSRVIDVIKVEPEGSSGYLYDNKAIMHQIQELKKILNKRL